jgi:hypothetical protein
MIADRFDDRTFANKEVAMERSLAHLGIGREDHEARRQIAQKLLECAEGGDIALTGLTEAGRNAATKLANARVK